MLIFFFFQVNNYSLEEVIYEEVVAILKNIFDVVYLKVGKFIIIYMIDFYGLSDIIYCKYYVWIYFLIICQLYIMGFYKGICIFVYNFIFVSFLEIFQGKYVIYYFYVVLWDFSLCFEGEIF